MRRLLAWALPLAVLPLAALAASRVWTDNTGSHSIEADLVGFSDGVVQLRREDGRVVDVPWSRLSAEDQDYVLAEMARREAEGAPAVTAVAATAAAPGSVSDTPWPQWRGPNRDGISPETGLLDQWTEHGPPIAWQARGLGGGYSSVAVAGGRVYTLGRRDGQAHLIALDERDGRELWAAPVGGGDPNGTPTVDGELVFAVGRDGDLVCVAADTGRELWRTSFVREFGAELPSWGFSESPLVDGDRLICTPGADRAVLAALDKRTGALIWTTTMPAGPRHGHGGAGYSSIVLGQGGGVRQYVQLVGRGVVGVATDDGRMLWGYGRIANGTANIPTPLVRGDYVFCSTGYGAGAALLQLRRAPGGGVNAEEVYFLPANRMQNHHGGMVLLDNYVYCGTGHNAGHPLCIELLTGREVWQPGRGPGEGSAAVACADGHLYFRYQDGTMALIEATPSRYNLKGTFQIASHNGESWPHPVIAGGRLYLRDQDELHCYDIRRR
jgi:outer membrane protein assembly factor BamB